MKGTLKKVDDQWIVEYPKYPTSGKVYETASLPLYYDDAIYCFPSDIGDEVNFEIVDEFTHPQLFESISWGDGPPCAKLIK